MSTPEFHCECCERNETNKEDWGQGPWLDEPNRVQWQHSSGLHCIAHRNRFGAWCGYVGVPPSHPMHGKDYDSVDADVHGGLTYSAPCDGGHICHVAPEGEPDEVWWFGFDCAHSGDSCPSYLSYGFPSFANGTYRTLGYVQNETNQLAEQLANKLLW